MNTPPDIDPDEIAAILDDGWGFRCVELSYAPVGFGSHHWMAADATGERRFVTVDDLSKLRIHADGEVVFRRLAAAFGVAHRLSESGLDFVVAPLPDNRGEVLRRLNAGYSIAVLPFVQGETSSDGEYASDKERRLVSALLERLHERTPLVEDVAGREDFALPCRTEIALGLSGLDRVWEAGPYSERTRQLLISIRTDLLASLVLYDRLVEGARSASTPWVITHGEPHAANVIWTTDGPRLIDWDTALIAPPERDRWMLTPADDHEGGTMMLYRLWWDLAEIAGYVANFHATHRDTEDAEESWSNLLTSAAEIPRWARVSAMGWPG